MKLSYNKYKILQFANKKAIEKIGNLLNNSISSFPAKTEYEKILDNISKAIFVDGVLTNKPIYFLAESFSEQFLKFAEKNGEKFKSDSFFPETNENCIMIFHIGKIVVQHIENDIRHILCLTPSGGVLSYCIIDNQGVSKTLYESGKDYAKMSLIILDVILFKKYAEVEQLFIKSCSKKTCPNIEKGKFVNDTGIDVILLDSRWFREIIRTEGFKVSGHFRLQPYKNEKGEWTKKLIYINEFEKHGYHRRAKIEA